MQLNGWDTYGYAHCALCLNDKHLYLLAFKWQFHTTQRDIARYCQLFVSCFTLLQCLYLLLNQYIVHTAVLSWRIAIYVLLLQLGKTMQKWRDACRCWFTSNVTALCMALLLRYKRLYMNAYCKVTCGTIGIIGIDRIKTRHEGYHAVLLCKQKTNLLQKFAHYYWLFVFWFPILTRIGHYNMPPSKHLCYLRGRQNLREP